MKRKLSRKQKRNLKRKQRLKRKKSRDWIAVSACFRKAGPIKDKKKELAKKICRKKLSDE